MGQRVCLTAYQKRVDDPGACKWVQLSNKCGCKVIPDVAFDNLVSVQVVDWAKEEVCRLRRRL